MERKKSRLNLWRETSLGGIFRDVWSFLLFALRRFAADRMSQAAGALTFSTLLAIVPLLVIAFSILAGFPAFDSFKKQILDTLLGSLIPDVGADVRTYLSDFTDGASNLTSVGVVALAVTAIMLLSTIEATLNRIWKIDRPRPFVSRLLIFWAILTIGPLLVGASFSLTSDGLATVRAWQGDLTQVKVLSLPLAALKNLLAILAQSVAFTLLFVLVPARTVRLRDAAIGGIFAGLGFQLLRWGFDTFLTSGSTYATIYGAVAVIPIFLIWVYLSWTVVILGAVLAASFPTWWQRRDVLTGRSLSPGETLGVAVAILAIMTREAAAGRTVETATLTEAVPLLARDAVLERLSGAGYVAETMEDRLGLIRDLHAVSVADLARDLDLSLGLTSGRGDSSALDEVLRASGHLPNLLRQLGRTEADILSEPVAGLLDRARDVSCDPTMNGTVTQLTDTVEFRRHRDRSRG